MPADPRHFDAIEVALARPTAYPWSVSHVDVVRTHSSLVFLAGSRVVKLKRPVDLGFLDYSTLERRRRFCLEEVRLNQRLASDVYLGVVAVTGGEDRWEVALRAPSGEDEPAVLMVRLPDEATLSARLRDAPGSIGPAVVRRIGAQLAAFHAAAARSPRIAEFGRLEVVAGNADENFAQTESHVGRFVHPEVWHRCRRATARQLSNLGPLIEARARCGVPCETHGDLRLDHVYLLRPEPPAGGPDRLAIIDCIEFNERFRYADPVSDLAFLSMELRYAGRGDLAAALEAEWISASGDPDAAPLLPMYLTYRSIVRAKVRGFLALDEGADPETREHAAARARAHWMLALDTASAPAERPAMLLTCGLPGSGKSTVAALLAEQAGFEVIRSDVVRKELAGLAPDQSAAARYGAGIYSAEMSEATYAACLACASERVAAGARVVVDATFRREAARARFAAAASAASVRFAVVHCELDDATAAARLAAREGDASDADARIRAAAAREWEAPAGPDVIRLSTAPSRTTIAATLTDLLRARGLL